MTRSLNESPGRPVAWYWRLGAWLLAVPLGFVIAALPIYFLHVVSKNDVLSVFVDTGLGRYGRLAFVTVIWALAIALLVTLFTEVAAQRRDRERYRRAEGERMVYSLAEESRLSTRKR